MDSILKLENVSFIYGAGTPFEKKALDKVSVEFKKGAITGLIGHTGSGKSTLVNLLNGLYKPSEGRVLFDGEDIWKNPKDISRIRARVGLVMQYPEYQLFDETVMDDIAYGPKNLGLSAEEIRVRVLEAAEFTGIDRELLANSPFDLSGGQKRRVAIAGIIAMRPDVLVLDEPAAGLDPGGRREILGNLCRYVEKYNASVILVSHSMEDMALYCDHVVVMANSAVHKCGTVDEIFSDADGISSIGLDIPSVSKIVTYLRKKGIILEGKLYTVDGVAEAIKGYIGRCKR